VNWKQKEINLADVRALTYRRRQSRDLIVARAKALVDDPDRQKRLQAQLCLMCYHDTRLAGQAFTDTNCRACNKDMQFSSTDVDALCPECARALKLCRHCGADLNLRWRKVVAVATIPKVTPFEPPPLQPAWPSAVLLLPRKDTP